ncbi:MAG: cytochrome-c oxidase, cbb3-type subunit I [Melioribacter sp.]|nr:cytochrome-c oxidase, cbb3-type subunit I [Melioribacter sp.]
MTVEKFSYDNQIVKNFTIATVVWGIVGMLVGVIIAIQLYLPELNFGIPYLTFGRIRPLHTNAVIFAFVGNLIFAGIYYSLPRLCKASMWSKVLSNFHFWGWQSIIVLAAVTLPLGITTSKEYAELEWPIDILIALVWVAFGANMLGTIIKRREKHMYVAIWFYIATFVTVTVLHVVNSLEIPATLTKSYPIYAGVQDALVQWWYGHNAVAFFLTTPFLGLMYYFLPKAANRPVYSYRLSILHFWALIFLYIWAGPHHLLYSALPDWAQSLGTVFSIMLIAPSWGGMINGLLTLRGAWDRVRDNPILKFMVVAVTAYGMATFEGPMLSLKNVNAIAHFTDWIIAHVHVGALGWNGMLTFGILYWMVPKMWNTDLYSKKMANAHFWISTLGIVFYAIPMYWSGIAQSLMWKQFTPLGILQYPNFLETTLQIIPFHIIRSLGGTLYLAGIFLMGYNLLKTAKQGKFVKEEEAEAAPLIIEHDKMKRGMIHRWLEKRPVQFTLLATVAILIGGVVEFVPTFVVKSNIPTIASVKPYTPLEMQGRDIYIREGCNTCHSQLVRPFRSETERYGEYSKAGEYVYDHPFLWGSKRTGPDLHRVGGKYSNLWHYLHFEDPRQMSPGSIMPRYPWLLTQILDTSTTAAKISALRSVGVDYEKGYEKFANEDLVKQANLIADDLINNGVPADWNTDVIALIAYLQRLGKDIKGNQIK